MKTHTDEHIEAWADLFVKHRVLTLTSIKFVVFINASDIEKRFYINKAIAKREKLKEKKNG